MITSTRSRTEILFDLNHRRLIARPGPKREALKRAVLALGYSRAPRLVREQYIRDLKEARG